MKTMKVGRWILFLLLVVVFGLLLRVLNWVPEALQDSSFRDFGSLEQLRQAYPQSVFYLPRYFPMQLEWPPAEILAQSRPYFQLLVHVRDQETGDIVLAIRQVETEASEVQPLRIRPAAIQREEQVDLDGRAAVLSQGRCRDGTVCNQASWAEGAFELTVVTRESADELLRIARSMIP